MARDPLAALAEELGRALQPLVDAASSPAALHDLLLDLGWEIDPVPPAVQALRAPAEQVFRLVDGAAELDAGDLLTVLNGVRGLATAVAGLAGAAGLPPGFGAAFPRDLVDYLVVDYLLHQQPRVGALLEALGILRRERVEAAGGRPAHIRRTVAYEAMARLVDDPLALFHGAYRWGESDFRGEDVLARIAALAESWGVDMAHDFPEPTVLGHLNAGAVGDADDRSLRLVLLHSDSGVPTELGAAVLLLPETASGKPGLAVLPYGTVDAGEDVPLGERATARVEGTASLRGVAALVRPSGVSFEAGLDSAGGPSTAGGTLTVALLFEPGQPTVVLGDPTASRFELAGASVLAGARFQSSGQFEVFVEAALEGAKLVIRPAAGESDAFLAQLLPAGGISVETDLTVGFSTTQGLYFGGSGGLEVAIPAHVQLGPVEVLGALVGVRVAAGGGGSPAGLDIDLAASLRAGLAVVTAVVENVGVTFALTFPTGGTGNLGPLDLRARFKPPNGVGLSIDAGVVKGGGYLFVDAERGEYAGALELTVANFLSLKAIGLISTRLPGGQPGFSLLVVMTAEFTPGFQLGYGFTLLGVGGVLGLNRGMLLEPLTAGIRTGAVNSILFPTNVVENAPRILSDLRAVFPPREGVFLIGPMAKIGWGTPTLISVSLGVVIEIPGNVAIVGRLRVALPTDEAAVIVLQVSFVGALEFDKRRVWFFASLFESRLLSIPLDGEMGLLMDFSDDPNFVLSVGGFHPRFTPPPLPFPAPSRLALSLINERAARVRVDAYFAVTSNTVQAGAHAEAFFGFSSLSVEGHFGFDALVRFSPLYLIVEISCGFSVKVFGMGVYGVRLRGTLEGPTPWHISGSASIEFLFFSISVDVDVTFGERRADTLPPLAVLPALRRELQKLDSWRATPPASGRALVSLRELGDPSLLVLHPVGTLSISQRFVPLNLPLDKVGNQKPSDITRATLSVTAGPLSVRRPARERFAAAQFRDMDDAAKLSAPAFELLESGVELAPEGNPWATGPAAQRTVRYEQIVVDSAFERVPKRFFPFWAGLFSHFRRGGAVARCSLSQAAERRTEPFVERVRVVGDRFVVAHAADNTVVAAEAVFASHAEALAHLQSAVRADPALAASIHVIPAAEVNAAA